MKFVDVTPEGYLYGFPKVVSDKLKITNTWLRFQGYPVDEFPYYRLRVIKDYKVDNQE